MHLPYGSHELPARPLLLLLSNPTDCDALAVWCRQRLGWSEVDSASQLPAGLAIARQSRPQLAVLDPVIAENAIEACLELLRIEAVGHLLVLDQRPSLNRLLQLLPNAKSSYVSREAGPQVLLGALTDVLAHGRRVFDPSFASYIQATPHGFELKHPVPGGAVNLTQRERQVMKLLVHGRSVRQCAEELGLSQSTIDNHKSRLMKKLGVHKSSQLALQAIRQGLVVI
jgi:DNA-binding NarL/FixJ family response regulator